jgi:hypothetical protein
MAAVRRVGEVKRREVARRLALRAAVAVAVLAGAGRLLAGEGKERIDDPGRTFAGASFMSDGVGGVVTWDSAAHSFTRWAADGRSRGRCTPNLEAVGRGFCVTAVKGDRALVVFSDVAPGTKEERRFGIVDLEPCKVVAMGQFRAGHPWILVAGGDGWLACATTDRWMKPDKAGERPRGEQYEFVEMNDQGKVGSRFEVREAIEELVRHEKLDVPFGPRMARLVAVGRETWVLPQAAYALVRPAQGGRSLRVVEPPECLAARGRQYTEAEAEAFSQKQYWGRMSPDERKSEEEKLKGARRRSTTAFQSPVVSAVPYRRYLAVVVRDGRLEGGARLDIWDMTDEAPVAILPFSADEQLVGFSDERGWVVDGERRVRELGIPELQAPLDDPCATYGALAKVPTPTPVPTPPPTPQSP